VRPALVAVLPGRGRRHAARARGGRRGGGGRVLPPYIAAVAAGSAAYGFLALLLSIDAARRLTGHGVLAGVAVWFGTPLLFYMYAAPGFSHAPSAFAVALFVWVWLRVRERWTPSGVAALGAAAALMTMVREQDVFYAAGPAVDWALAGVRREPGERGVRVRQGTGRTDDAASRPARHLLAAAAGLGAFLVAYLPQLLAYWSLNGRLGPSQLVTRKMTWTAPHAPGVLASPQHGLFVWTPLALLACAGLVLLWRRSADDRRRVAACLLLMFALQVYVSGSVESWTVAGAFGQRRFVGATVLLVIGLAALAPAGAARGRRAAFAVVVSLAVWWNIGLMALFGAGLMDRQRLNVPENAYHVFVTLPRRGPELAYRYFTARESFYQPPR
jgi:hypothetical protein